MTSSGVPMRWDPARVCLGLGVLLVGVLLLAVSLGSVSLPASDVIGLLVGRLRHAAPPADRAEASAILFQLRLPRVGAAAVSGAALSVAGALLQALFRNPLADPYVVGASGGAALGAVGGLLLAAACPGLPFSPLVGFAFAGSLLAVWAVTRLATVHGRLPTTTILLAGFAVSTLLGYAVSAVMLLVNRLELHLPRLYSWLLGGVQAVEPGVLGTSALILAAGTAAALALGPAMNALMLGDEGAARLGVEVEGLKRRVLGLASLLTAAAVSMCGLVGFVGLVVPHCTRWMTGPDLRRVIPASALLGAAFLTLADLLSRSLLPPAELPLGVVTAVLGGPAFLMMLRAAGKSFAW